MNVYLVVLAVGVSAALLLVSLPRVEGLRCVHCSYQRVRCKTLPKSCQATRGTCGCCDICAGKVGQKCSIFKPCEKRLICKRTGWSSAWKRSGTCQRPVKG